jgi:hypothetical protein
VLDVKKGTMYVPSRSARASSIVHALPNASIKVSTVKLIDTLAGTPTGDPKQLHAVYVFAQQHACSVPTAPFLKIGPPLLKAIFGSAVCSGAAADPDPPIGAPPIGLRPGMTHSRKKRRCVYFQTPDTRMNGATCCHTPATRT